MTDRPDPTSRDRHSNDTGRSPDRTRIRDVVAAATLSAAQDVQLKMRASGLTVRYGEKVAIKDVDIEVHGNQVLALIGPSGCGKSTFLRSLNRMNDTVAGVSVTGQVHARRRGHLRPRRRPGPRPPPRRDGVPEVEPVPEVDLRERGLRPAHRRRARARRSSRERVERALRHAALWDEVKDRLDDSGLAPLRRSAAAPLHRARARRRARGAPDGRARERARPDRDGEDRGPGLRAARRSLTIVIVTHNMQQAARVSQRTGFFYMGRLVEVGDTTHDLHAPQRARDRGLHHRPVRLRKTERNTMRFAMPLASRGRRRGRVHAHRRTTPGPRAARTERRQRPRRRPSRSRAPTRWSSSASAGPRRT